MLIGSKLVRFLLWLIRAHVVLVGLGQLLEHFRVHIWLKVINSWPLLRNCWIALIAMEIMVVMVATCQLLSSTSKRKAFMFSQIIPMWQNSKNALVLQVKFGLFHHIKSLIHVTAYWMPWWMVQFPWLWIWAHPIATNQES